MTATSPTPPRTPRPGACPVPHGASAPGVPDAAAPRREADAAADALAAAIATPSGPGGARSDEGYFGPDSVSWRVFSDPSSRIGGVAALLLQSLNPMMMRVFAGTSGYESDAEGRNERTGRYLDTTVFGDRAHADAAGEAVQRLHAHSVWTDPRTGEQLRADTPEWLAWTHNTLVYGFLRAADAFGPMLTVAEQDRFVQEQHEAARLVGITDAALLPSSRAALDAYIEENKDWMALSLPAAEVTRNLRRPKLGGNPVTAWISVTVQDGILSLLPDWALLLFGVAGRPMNLRAAARTTRYFVARARTNTTTESLIAEVTERVNTHPYRKVRRR